MYNIKVKIEFQCGNQACVVLGTVNVASSVNPRWLSRRIRDRLDLGLSDITVNEVSNVYVDSFRRSGGMTIHFASLLHSDASRINLQDVFARIDMLSTFKPSAHPRRWLRPHYYSRM